MTETNLFVTCVTAFAVVFGLLSMLSLAIRLITLIFPGRIEPLEDRDDAAVVAAISVTVSCLFPGAKATRIQEES